MARYGRAKYSSNEPKAKEVKLQHLTAVFDDALEYLDGNNYTINEFRENSNAKAWAQEIERKARIEETLAFYESEH